MKPVTEANGSDQPSGSPINDSTNPGFRSASGEPGRPAGYILWTWRPSEGPPFLIEVSASVPRLPSDAIGVGHINWVRREASPASVLPCVTPCEGAFLVDRFSLADALGVGHIWVCTVRLVGCVLPPPIRDFIARCASGVFPSSLATGMPHICVNTGNRLEGQEPESLPLVGCANGGCGEQTPLRIEPEVGKILEDVGKPSDSLPWVESGDVLQEDVRRCHVSDDSCDLRPEPTVVVNSTSPASRRPGLTREPRTDEIHDTAPLMASEGREIVPDGRSIQGLVFHPRHESGRCVGVPLNVSHGSGMETKEVERKGEPAVTGAQFEDMEGTYSHTRRS